jgi:hypothetical protein
MTHTEIIQQLQLKGKKWLENPPQATIMKATDQNPWFTETDIRFSLKEISLWLAAPKLTDFLKNYTFQFPPQSRRLGLILAGNIPAAGFHDVLMGVFSGYLVYAKCSHLDSVLIPAFFQDVLPELITLSFPEKLSHPDALIASGSDLTAQYLSHTYADIPVLIRGNRFSVGIMEGTESRADLDLLVSDILRYNGMGCRNVSNLLVPSNWVGLDLLTEALLDARKKHSFSLPYLRKVAWEQGIENWKGNIQNLQLPVCLRTNSQLSPVEVGVLQLVQYTDAKHKEQLIQTVSDSLQCICGIDTSIPFGKTQSPALDDFADGVDTLRWIGNLESHYLGPSREESGWE